MTAARRLAAILAVDVVGTSRLVGEDEAGTARAVREHREAARPTSSMRAPAFPRSRRGELEMSVRFSRLNPERRRDLGQRRLFRVAHLRAAEAEKAALGGCFRDRFRDPCEPGLVGEGVGRGLGGEKRR